MSRIPASGAMTWNDIQNSFGGSNPIGINEYYRNSTYVPGSDLNSDIPTSGQIEATDFRGADGFNGTSGSLTAGSTGGKNPQVGYIAGSTGSNLGTAITTGSAGNGSFKFNCYQINSSGVFAQCAYTRISPANGNLNSLNSKAITVTGNPGGAFTMSWPTTGIFSVGEANQPPASFGGSSTSDGALWGLGDFSGGGFASGTTYTFSIN